MCEVLTSLKITSHHTRGMNKAEQHAQSLQRDLMLYKATQLYIFAGINTLQQLIVLI